MKWGSVLALLLFLVSKPMSASESEERAHRFSTLYATICGAHIFKLDTLRAELNSVPKLPAEKAARFLNSYPGDARPVPVDHGNFVLAIPHEVPMCVVYARRASSIMVEAGFLRFVAEVSPPFTAKKTIDKYEPGITSEPVHTLAYEWSTPTSARKLLFILTTTESQSGPMQAMGSVSLSSD
ncbi:NMCC_0638 family (lipo)protein [Pseudomonas sp. DC3000-4b1]|uniref:NMCC_0638 family (lipo)protein n=1 Tax=unclassified Pseudomonas TaxID=196821 RepID=UPI003CFB41EA